MNTHSTLEHSGFWTSSFQFAAMGENPCSAKDRSMLTAVDETKGLMKPSEALALFRICRHLPDSSHILEIGSYLGASTVAMGQAIAGKNIGLYCLDCWHDYKAQGFFDHALAGTTATDIDVFTHFLENTAFLGSDLRILKGTTAQFNDLLPNCFFDLIFIDGAHDYQTVVQDILLGLRILKPGSLLCGHDFHSDGEGVTRAVNELIAYSPGIKIKGVIPETSIWYAAVPDPVYEHARATVLAHWYRDEEVTSIKLAQQLAECFPDRPDATKLVKELTASLPSQQLVTP